MGESGGKRRAGGRGGGERGGGNRAQDGCVVNRGNRLCNASHTRCCTQIVPVGQPAWAKPAKSSTVAASATKVAIGVRAMAAAAVVAGDVCVCVAVWEVPQKRSLLITEGRCWSNKVGRRERESGVMITRVSVWILQCCTLPKRLGNHVTQTHSKANPSPS